MGTWRSNKGLKRGRVMDGKRKGELRVGKRGWAMSRKNCESYGWEKGESYGWEKWGGLWMEKRRES